MQIDLAGHEVFNLTTLVLDYNGSLAEDGALLPGVGERIHELAERLEIVVLTADTHGTCGEKLTGLPVRVEIISGGKDSEDSAKRRFVEHCGADESVAIGNGQNDASMLALARVGIAVIQAEGASPAALMAADVVVSDIRNAFDLLLRASRLVATLRV